MTQVWKRRATREAVPELAAQHDTSRIRIPAAKPGLDSILAITRSKSMILPESATNSPASEPWT